MFRLTIELPPHVTVQTHPNRELARAELLDCLTAAGLPYRTAAASWAYTSYTITARGHAVIEEICGCEHTEDEHHDNGCTFTSFECGRRVACPCPRYAPVPDAPTLFDAEPPAPATGSLEPA